MYLNDDTKMYIRFLIIVCKIFMIIFKNYFLNLLSCPHYFKMDFFDQNSAPAISGILAKYAFRVNRHLGVLDGGGSMG